MSSVLEQLRTDLAGRRVQLIAEREQLLQQVSEIDVAIDGINQVLGSGRKPAAPAGRVTSGAPEVDEKALLQEQIRQALIQAHPQGLSSVDLQKLLQPNWSYGELSLRRIGNNCARMTELTSDGERWYYVPAEPPQDEPLPE